MAESSGNTEREGKTIRVGILTVSDSCSSGQTEDRSGTNLKHLIEGKKLIHGDVCVKEIVPDEIDKIKDIMMQWTDKLRLDLILSTGGTGFTARDVTPEATKSVLDRDAIGITVAMLAGSLSITPLAMLSRRYRLCEIKQYLLGDIVLAVDFAQCPDIINYMTSQCFDIIKLTCGIRKSTLIINLPGSTKGAEECFRFAAVGVSHAVDQLRGAKSSVKKTHSHLQGEGIQTDQPGQLQPMSDESLDNSVEILDPPSEIPDSVIDTVFPSTVAFSSLDSSSVSRTTPVLSQNSHSTPISHQTDCQETAISEKSGSLDKSDNSSSADLSQLCFQGDQSNSNLPEEQLTIISLVANQYNDDRRSTSYDKQDKEISGLFQFKGNFSQSSSSQQVLTCKTPKVRTVTPPQITSQVVQEILTLPVHSTCTPTAPTSTGSDSYNSVYEFQEEGEKDTRNKSQSENKRSPSSTSEDRILRAKLHKNADEGEVTHVNVGPDIKMFLRTHPAIRGIYLNKGKRDVKRNLVKMRRESNAVDIGSWQRGSRIHDRNRLDDYFDLTEEGREKKKKVEVRYARDEYVVNWYMWCPGHGNCQRKCGGYGKCISGCKGKTHKQDRHNCRLLLNLKLFLSDTSKWRVHISGCHVPLKSNILWEPPAHCAQRISEDTRDIIIATATTKKTTSSQIQEALSKRPMTSDLLEVPSKRKICRFVSSMKKRRRQKNYKCRDDLTETEESCNVEDKDVEPKSVASAGDVENEEEEEEEQEEAEMDQDQDVEVVEAKEKKTTDISSVAAGHELKTLHTVSDSLQSDESNIVPTATLIKIIDTAGNVYYYTRNVGENRTGALVAAPTPAETSTSVTQTDLVLPSSPITGQLAATPRYIFASPCEVGDSGRELTSPDQEVSGCGDLGALILAAYQHH